MRRFFMLHGVRVMNLRFLAFAALAGATLLWHPSPRAAQPLTAADEAHAIALEAYLYLYPLVIMDITRKQSTNIEPGKELGKGPMNMFVNIPEYPPASFKGVVRPNFDTLYSSAWLDLTKEPLVVSAPDTNGRYYLLPMMDMWTDVFASPGWRTTRTDAANFLVTPPGWQGDVPEGFQHIKAPTPYVWIIGRTKTDGPQDYDAVHRIQAGFKVTPLSQWGKTPEPVSATIDPSVDMKTPPKVQADTMAADTFFPYAAELLKLQPPHITDEPIIARMKRIGISAGESLQFDTLDPAIKTALTSAPEDAHKLMGWKTPSLARVANGWSMNTDTMGVYGNYYLKRAMVAQMGLGANLPEDAIYPFNLADNLGSPLDGTHKYRIRFGKDGVPPVNAFWSVTLYDPEGFPVANPINRSAISSWMPLQREADGSLSLSIQHDSPGAGKEANWLPAPAGPFNLTMRLYAPKLEALTGQWNPPAVERIEQKASTKTQTGEKK